MTTSCPLRPRLATVGLRTRKLRSGLSALGTNLLVVESGQTLFGQPAELPKAAPAMIWRVDAVTQVQETGSVTGDVYRSPLIPTIQTSALSIEAASLGLLHTVGTSVARGRYLNAATRSRTRLRTGRRRRPAPWDRPDLCR